MTGVYQWIQQYLVLHPLFSPLLFIFFHILFAACLIPCSPMAVIAGLLWGNWMGLAISTLAAFVSSCCTFGLSRIFLKNKIYRFFSKRYPRTDWFLESTKKHGWKFVASVQLNPVAPGSALGYLFGLTNIEFSVYARYLILFMLPLQLLLVAAGGSLSQVLNSGEISWLYLELIIFIFAVYLVYRIYKNKSIGRSQLDDDQKKL